MRDAGYAPGLTGENAITVVSTITPEQERWAEALFVQRVHGERAPLHVAERIGALALAGDANGVERWREIARHLDQLIRPETVQ